MFRSRFFILTAAVAVAAALAAPATSEATFTLTLKTSDAGDGSVVATDGTTGTNPDGTLDGAITINNKSFGGFTTSTTAASSNSINNLIPATIGVSSISTINNSGVTKTLIVTLHDDGYHVPTGLVNLLTSLSASDLVKGDNTTVQISLNGSPATLLSLTGINADGSGVDNISANDAFTAGNPYTLDLVMTITLKNGDEFDGVGNGKVSPAPAPAGLVMLASALPFAGLLRLRRRLAKTEAVTAA